MTGPLLDHPTVNCPNSVASGACLMHAPELLIRTVDAIGRRSKTKRGAADLILWRRHRLRPFPTTGRESGHGVGLTLCRDAVEARPPSRGAATVSAARLHARPAHHRTLARGPYRALPNYGQEGSSPLGSYRRPAASCRARAHDRRCARSVAPTSPEYQELPCQRAHQLGDLPALRTTGGRGVGINRSGRRRADRRDRC
jgi:hypothetical protein